MSSILMCFFFFVFSSCLRRYWYRHLLILKEIDTEIKNYMENWYCFAVLWSSECAPEERLLPHKPFSSSFRDLH